MTGGHGRPCPIYNGDFSAGINGWTIQNATPNVVDGALSIASAPDMVGFLWQDTAMTVKNTTQIRLGMHITNPNPTSVSVTVSLKDTEGGAGDYGCTFLVPGGTTLGDFALVWRLGGGQDIGRMLVEYRFPPSATPLPLTFDDIHLKRVKDTFFKEGGECISPPEPGELYQTAFDLTLTPPTTTFITPTDIQYEHGAGEPELGCIGTSVNSVWYSFVAATPLSIQASVVVDEGQSNHLIVFSEKNGTLYRVGCQHFCQLPPARGWWLVSRGCANLHPCLRSAG